MDTPIFDPRVKKILERNLARKAAEEAAEWIRIERAHRFLLREMQRALRAEQIATTRSVLEKLLFRVAEFKRRASRGCLRPGRSMGEKGLEE